MMRDQPPTFFPRTTPVYWLLQGDTWTRVSGVHGQTLLSLGFNYRILSLSTLTFGTDTMTVNVTDRPRACMAQLNETDKIRTVLQLLMTDFETEEPTTDQSRDYHQYQVEFLPRDDAVL